MKTAAELELQSYVLLRLGERRFALAAREIAELVAPSRVFRFPQQTKEIEGVILRRGRIVPVCDVSERLLGNKLTSRRFYLLAARKYGEHTEWVALPVSGECELINAEMMPAGESDSNHVAGWLSHGAEVIEVLDLEALTPGPGTLSTHHPEVSAAQEARP
ncbi:MAG TPA: chemotaxis protein CheW [Terriglobales bacterium]|nr:chemotaxis protein CheW [Terriglobales bacterium]